MPRPDWIDNPSIPSDAALWRGVIPSQLTFDTEGHEIPQSGAFRNKEMSVNIAAETTIADMMRKAPAVGWRLWEFTAGVARAAGCIVDRDPLEDDPGHSVVLSLEDPGERALTPRQAYEIRGHGHWAT